MGSSRHTPAVKAAGFGTFAAVFTPCTLTILGVIMFLRLGHVVGHAGVWQALLIILLAKLITTLTALSLSAIATNTRVQGGGAYFLISRSLGVESGTSIGVVFFLAQAVSVALYVLGFSEALLDALSLEPGRLALVATVTNAAVFLCVVVGAGWAIRVQYVILGMLGLSLVSFYAGAAGRWDAATFATNWGPQYGEGETFFTMFALFFPAVTGIMAGANMSGELADPGRSIPLGTLSAVAVTAVIYLTEALCLAGCAPAEVLKADALVMKRVALVPGLINMGVFAATLSSAIGSMLGAPRILQAIADDRVIPWLHVFRTRPGSGEPRAAVALTFVISQLCIVVADLDTVAPVITMFFMITYGTLNLATFYEAITRNPSYRPRFRFNHWSLSLAGAAACVLVMFLLDWQAALLALGTMAALYWWVSSHEIEQRWGDLRYGLLFERTRRNLLKLERELEQHPKDWRPILLTLSGTVGLRPRLPVFGHWLTAGHSLQTLAQIIRGNAEELVDRRAKQEEFLQEFIEDQDLDAFPAVVVAPTLSAGIDSLIQCHGLGALRPNTVLLGWPTSAGAVESFGRHLRVIAKLGCSIVAARFEGARAGDSGVVAYRSRGESAERAAGSGGETSHAEVPSDRDRKASIADGSPEDPWAVPRGTIDVWWRGARNGALMLLLAHLLRQNRRWRDHDIRLIRVIESEGGRAEVERHLQALVHGARIEAETLVYVHDDPAAVIREQSADAAVSFVGFTPPQSGEEVAFYERLESLVGDLSRVLFVHSVGPIALDA